MRILFVSVEVTPMAKVGGLADVAGSLPAALAARGHEVRVVTPAYPMITQEPKWAARLRKPSIRVPIRPGFDQTGELWTMTANGVEHWLLGGSGHFDRCVNSAQLYSPGRDAYLFLARAAMRVCEEEGWIPDLVHANDWHTGFFPVLIREQGGPAWDSTGCVFTIHNLAYQGEFGPDTLDAVGLPQALFNYHQLETFGAVNFLKAGAIYSDQVNTVSPTYAREIQTAEYGCRLDGPMRFLAEEGRLRGILNGISYDYWNPETDPHLTSHYSADHLKGKTKCREWLIQEFDLKVPDRAPIVGMVSRLSEQKGFDLIARAAEHLVNLPMTLVVLGHGDLSITAAFQDLAQKFPGRVVLADRFDEELAHRIYAGSDAFLMPSAFEPCGLGQMIAMHYGTLPIVRKTGGLADSVQHDRNGFVFEAKSTGDLMIACAHAVQAYQNSSRWSEMVRTAMTDDFSWTRSAAAYEDLYEKARQARRKPAAVSVG